MGEQMELWRLFTEISLFLSNSQTTLGNSTNVEKTQGIISVFSKIKEGLNCFSIYY